MASPIPYPLVNGVRHSFASVELNMNGQVFVGFKSVNYKRTRNVAKVHGNHPDPIGQTLGVNEYTAEAEIYLAEYTLLQTLLGPGYGDVFFTVLVTYTATGFTTVQDILKGCRVLEVDANPQQGPDPLVRKVRLDPLKILFGGVDDVLVPLVGVIT